LYTKDILQLCISKDCFTQKSEWDQLWSDSIE